MWFPPCHASSTVRTIVEVERRRHREPPWAVPGATQSYGGLLLAVLHWVRQRSGVLEEAGD